MLCLNQWIVCEDSSMGRDVLCSLEKLFLNLSEGWCAEQWSDAFKLRSREGIFSHALTMWLMITQRIGQRHTLVGALEALTQGGADTILSKTDDSKRIRNNNIPLNSGGYAQARQRLSVEKVKKLGQFISDKLNKDNPSQGLWRNRPAVVLDGTYITLPGEQSVKRKYPAHRNQHGEMHNPKLLVVLGHNVMTARRCPPTIRSCLRE